MVTFLKHNFFFFFNIVPKYLFDCRANNIVLYNIDTFYIIELLFFFFKHINSQLKVLIDLVTIDLFILKFRFVNIYNILSILYNSRFFFKSIIGISSVTMSLRFLYSNINWYERESWDLFGILYLYHSDLRRLLTDYGFHGHPLRKDFPLCGFFELKYNFIKKKIFVSDLKLIQSYRIFHLVSPWNYFI